jgi:uncharacterized protein YuzE
MSDWERLKQLILELRDAGEDEALDVEDYAEICMLKIEEAAELLESMTPPPEAAPPLGEC